MSKKVNESIFVFLAKMLSRYKHRYPKNSGKVIVVDLSDMNEEEIVRELDLLRGRDGFEFIIIKRNEKAIYFRVVHDDGKFKYRPTGENESEADLSKKLCDVLEKYDEIFKVSHEFIS